ncbi:MAG: hypothetical protein CM15mP120_27900 [Pseudomonadota bacterium]|nr:MAG: hypothetical protein CM15mP120_27900 [Pseudomonadota bacterium]
MVTTGAVSHDQRMVNLLDTPGHEDFPKNSAPTVDSALMVIDGAKGVDPGNQKMEVCRRGYADYYLHNKRSRNRDPKRCWTRSKTS